MARFVVSFEVSDTNLGEVAQAIAPALPLITNYRIDTITKPPLASAKRPRRSLEGIVLAMCADGKTPHKAELREAAVEAGYLPGSVASIMSTMVRKGTLKRVPTDRYAMPTVKT